MSPLETSVLFTPGRASYIDSDGILQLSEASQRRAQVANETYDSDFHVSAVFAGGYPGLAQAWDESLVPPANRREAHLMARPLVNRLRNEGRTAREIARVVAMQGESSNSVGDVVLSVERGYLDPDTFNRNDGLGITLVAGALHGQRFKRLLSHLLDINPDRIKRAKIRDMYGTPEHPHQSAEAKPAAIAKEIAAIAITETILRGTKRGDLNAMKEAEQRFIAIAQRVS